MPDNPLKEQRIALPAGSLYALCYWANKALADRFKGQGMTMHKTYDATTREIQEQYADAAIAMLQQAISMCDSVFQEAYEMYEDPDQKTGG